MRLMFLDPPARPARSSTTFVITASLWLAVMGNLALWQSLMTLPEISGVHGAVFMLALALMIACAVTVVLSLLAWRYTLKAAIALLLLLAGFATYYMLMYGIVVDTPMLINVLQTDVREARDQISWQLLACVVFIAGLPLLWLWRHPLAVTSWQRQMGHNLGLLMGALLLLIGTTQWVFKISPR